jgi:formylglycine-generating enzyme required for sulfatase activity
MVRDDFWMGVTRLMQALDITIAENVNVTAVDLFDVRHARNVLRMFGVAYGRLPKSSDLMSPAQNRFLDAAVDYLSSDGRIICVQLALLTEMLKNHSWERSTSLFRDGGAGIGMQFLEETFDDESSPRRIRVHANGSLGVLRALLPEPGSHIKGQVRTKEELFQASGYTDPQQFSQLMSLLDRELHLVTPSDRSDSDSLGGDSSISGAQATGFQLTHDFLIAPIRQWVEYHNRSSPVGKARLRLDEFAELYKSRPRIQSLPTLSEYLSVRRYISHNSYTPQQRQVMTAARNYHLRSVGTWLAGIAVLGVGLLIAYNAMERRNRNLATQAEVARMVDANMAEAVELSEQLGSSELARQHALTIISNENQPLARRVRASLIVDSADATAVDLLTQFALTGPVDEVVELVKRRSLSSVGLGASAVEIWKQGQAPRETLIRAASMVANDPRHVQSLRNAASTEAIMKLVLAENPIWIKRWSEAFQPIAADLVPLLKQFLSDSGRSESSLNAVNLLIQYTSTDVSMLATLLAPAHPAELLALTDALASKRADSLQAVLRQWEFESAKNSPVVDLKQPWGSPWWCVGNRQPVDQLPGIAQLAPSLLQQLRDCESVIAEHAVIAHRVPPEALDQLTQALADAGYRLAAVSGLLIAEQHNWAVLWIRDGATSRFVVDATAREMSALNQENRAAGFLPDMINAFRRQDEGSILYSGIWIKPPNMESGLIDADLYLDIQDYLHEQEGWAKLGERGLGLPRSNLHVGKRDGIDYFSSVRWRTKRQVDYHDKWNMEWSEVSAIRRNNLSVLDLQSRASLQTAASPVHGATAIWWSDLPIQSKLVEHQGRREHFRMVQELIGQGYYPVSIDVSSSASSDQQDPTPLFGSIWWRGSASVEQQATAGKRLAKLALAMLRLGQPEQATKALSEIEHPALRGAMIALFAEHHLDPKWLIETLFNSADTILRRSCASALALYPPEELPRETAGDFRAELAKLFWSTGDPGLRSGIESIASKLGFNLEAATSTSPASELQSLQGDRLVIIEPENPIWIGSPAGEPGRDPRKEPLVPVKLAGTYALATREVTVAQYLRFQPNHAYPENYAPTTDCAVINVSWFDAAKYCRWLSELEGIPESEMCYPRLDEIKPGLQLAPGFEKRTGYRLPTEAEWELACRGGVEARRWFGFDPDRLAEHAWTTQNSDYQMRPVARLLPNDFGLYDMLGNGMEWCHAAFVDYPKLATEPTPDPGSDVLAIQAETLMVNRGGANLYQPLDARSSQRDAHNANSARVYITFRIARTVNRSQ